MWEGEARIDARSVPDVLYPGDNGLFDELYAADDGVFMQMFTCFFESGSDPIWMQCYPTTEVDYRSDIRMGLSHILLETGFDQEDWITEAMEESRGALLDTLRDTGEGFTLNMSILTSVDEGPWNILQVAVEDDNPERPLPIRATYCWDFS